MTCFLCAGKRGKIQLFLGITVFGFLLVIVLLVEFLTTDLYAHILGPVFAGIVFCSMVGVIVFQETRKWHKSRKEHQEVAAEHEVIPLTEVAIRGHQAYQTSISQEQWLHQNVDYTESLSHQVCLSSFEHRLHVKESMNYPDLQPALCSMDTDTAGALTERHTIIAPPPYLGCDSPPSYGYRMSGMEQQSDNTGTESHTGTAQQGNM